MAEAAHLDPMAPVPHRVLERRELNGDTFSLVLEPGPGAFEPGQFNMLYAFGVGESAISICGDPADGTRLVHAIRRVGRVTEALGRLDTGAIVGVRGPFGVPWPVATAPPGDLLIVAGGIGIAPLRPAILAALRLPERFERVFILLGARSPGDLLFAAELEEWAGAEGVELETTVDAGSPGWKGPVGVVTRLIPRAGFDRERVTALVCGPEIMMRFTALKLIESGVDPAAIHISMERNMKCGVGLCGHCQFGPILLCRSGPVVRYLDVQHMLAVREL